MKKALGTLDSKLGSNIRVKNKTEAVQPMFNDMILHNFKP